MFPFKCKGCGLCPFTRGYTEMRYPRACCNSLIVAREASYKEFAKRAEEEHAARRGAKKLPDADADPPSTSCPEGTESGGNE